MKPADKMIITCAVTGSVHTPTMSAHLPVTPDQIVEDSLAAAEAGAAILHLHARDPETGYPSADPDVFMQFLPRIKQRTDAVLNITTGGSVTMTLEERLAAAKRAEPELCSLNMGTMNFVIAPAADRYDTWKHDWEEPFLRSSTGWIYSNTFDQITEILTDVGERYGTRFEFECYDVGHLYTLAYFAEKGLAKPPFLIQFIFGILGGVGADIENMLHMKHVADRLFGDDYHLSVLAAGKHQMKFCTQSALLGGHVRVGLEDSLYASKGKLAVSNADQVRRIRSIAEALSIEIATPAEARAALDLKGGDAVAF